MISKAELLKSYIYDNSISPLSRKYCKVLNEVLIKKRKERLNNKYLTISETHNKISESILNSKPFMLGRLGNTERHILAEYLMKKSGMRKKYSNKWKNWLLSISGFFANESNIDEQIDKLMELFLDAMNSSDLEALWDYDYESIIMNEFAKQAEVTNANYTLIYSNLKESWGKALKNKKVLFVSPFENSIKLQYNKLDKIWGSYDLLPYFTLLTYKSPYTAAQNNPKNCTWFDIYTKMINEIKKIDFEIAIVGCGIYGYPLVSEIKKMGKVALHMCGETQIIMGITGKRWEDGGYVNNFINEYWIHPIDNKPFNFKNVEGGCYW